MMALAFEDPKALHEAFLEAACVPRDAGHATGTLEKAEALRAAHPELAHASIHTAAVLGEEATVEHMVQEDPSLATRPGGPHAWDALTYLCFSRYLRLDRSRTPGFVRAATALLDAGASANSGWWEASHQPHPVWESVLYGAAGVAQHPELTRLLLERGANPNDDEVPYHVPEGWDNAVLKIVVQSCKLTADNLATMLLRKTDWHDLEGVRWLLAQPDVDPNRLTHWGKTALHNAVLSDNAIEIVQALLEHGADPRILGQRPDVCRSAHGRSALALAAGRGRGDVLDACERQGFAYRPAGLEGLIAACARRDDAGARELATQDPTLRVALRDPGGTLLARFAGNGNTEGVRLLLEFGLDVGAIDPEGDGYFNIARRSTALHVAAWRARHDTVRLLIEQGAPIDVRDAEGNTPLALAVRACVDSYWTERRSPASVRLLLAAGASVAGVRFPSGFAAVDELLAAAGARS
jgi:ankyrin repeat protein